MEDPQKEEAGTCHGNGAFRIHFMGGPLDGDEILTDVLPQADYFIHRFGKLEYVYLYSWLAGDQFLAIFDGYWQPTAVPTRRSRTSSRLWLLIAGALLGLGCIFFWEQFV